MIAAVLRLESFAFEVIYQRMRAPPYTARPVPDSNNGEFAVLSLRVRPRRQPELHHELVEEIVGQRSAAPRNFCNALRNPRSVRSFDNLIEFHAHDLNLPTRL